MFSSQQLVIGWVEYSLAATILLAGTRIFVSRLQQPVDRRNLITMSLAASTLMPLVWCATLFPILRFDLFGSGVEQAAITKKAGHLPVTQQPPTLPGESTFETKSTETRAIASTASLDSQNHANSTANVTVNEQINGWSIAAVALLAIHGLAIIWLFLQWVIGALRLRSITSKTYSASYSVLDLWKETTNGKANPARILITTEVAAPMVFGWRSPLVLIPELIAEGNRSSLHYCLAHEWSHVNCGDLPRWKYVNFCQLLFWYQPLFWVLRRELQICQDLIADDRAARATGNELGPVEYSELLVTIASKANSLRLAGAIAFFDSSSQLSRRVKRLLTNEHPLRSRSTQSFTWVSGLSFLTGALLLGSVRLSSAHAAQGPADKPTESQAAGTNESSRSETQAAGQLKIVRGRVVNDAGEPIAGAKLCLPLTYRPGRTVQTTSDEDGNFKLQCPVEWINPRVNGSSWTAWAYAPGYSIQSQNLYRVLRGDLEDLEEQITIRLPLESNTRVKVLSPDGQPLAGVIVSPKLYMTSVRNATFVPEEMRSDVSARTDEWGNASLPAVQSNLLNSLELVCEEFGRQSMRINYKTDGRPRVIRLLPCAAIQGRVVAENPEWTRGVRLIFETGDASEVPTMRGLAEVVTDNEGNFNVPLIAAGRVIRTYVTLDPTIPVRPLLNDNRYLTAGETTRLEIPLIAAPIVHGKVVVKSTGAPVPNAELSLGYEKFQKSNRVITDEEGRFQGRVLPGPLRIDIVALPAPFARQGGQ